MLFGLAFVASGSESLKAPISWIVVGLLFVFAGARGHLFGVFDEPAVEVRDETLEATEEFKVISQRYLAGEISLDEAAGQIVTLVNWLEKKHKTWAFTFGSNLHATPEEDQKKFNELMDRITVVLKERESMNGP